MSGTRSRQQSSAAWWQQCHAVAVPRVSIPSVQSRALSRYMSQLDQSSSSICHLVTAKHIAMSANWFVSLGIVHTWCMHTLLRFSSSMTGVESAGCLSSRVSRVLVSRALSPQQRGGLAAGPLVATVVHCNLLTLQSVVWTLLTAESGHLS